MKNHPLAKFSPRVPLLPNCTCSKIRQARKGDLATGLYFLALILQINLHHKGFPFPHVPRDTSAHGCTAAKCPYMLLQLFPR